MLNAVAGTPCERPPIGLSHSSTCGGADQERRPSAFGVILLRQSVDSFQGSYTPKGSEYDAYEVSGAAGLVFADSGEQIRPERAAKKLEDLILFVRRVGLGTVTLDRK